MMRLCLVLVLFPFALAASCNHALCAKAVEPYAEAILPEYEAYVKADPKLNETESGISKELAEQRQKTKEAALKSAEGLRDAIRKLKEN